MLRTKFVKPDLNVSLLRLLHRRNLSSTVLRKAAIDMAAEDGELRVFIVSGEVSGDTIASRLMASLKKLSPFPVNFSGVGGSLMSKQGLNSLFPMEDIAIMGIWELLPHLNKIRRKLNDTIEAALLFQPHIVITVDSKGFSFRLLQKLRARYTQQNSLRPLHFHYVAPSFWAWKGGESRLKRLSEFIDHIFCILPFEEEVCRSNGIDATFVGHPMLEDLVELNVGKDDSLTELKVKVNCEGFNKKYGIPSGSTVITLLPGSRLQEVARLLPVFSNTIKLLNDSVPKLTTVIHVARNQHVENYINSLVHKWPVPAILVPGESLNLKYEAFRASRVALCTSGTVAMELQLARLPCVVAYRAHFLTELLIRYKAKVPYMSLPNILLDSAVIPEALFQACRPTKLASLLKELMQDEGLREKQMVAAERVLTLVCPPNVAVNPSAKQVLRWESPNWTPSMVAAFTILNYVKM